jgi:hypothetical protein
MPLGNTYETGLLTVAEDATTFHIEGALLQTVGIEEGDLLLADGRIAYIESVTGEEDGTVSPGWGGVSLTDAPYAILKMSWLRYDPALTQAKLREYLAAIEGVGYFWYVSGDEPDPSFGEDGHFALKTNDGSFNTWYKTGGVWVAQGAISAGGSTTYTMSDDGAAVGPTFTLERISASPAVDDGLGHFVFRGRDSAGNSQPYASIYSSIKVPTNGVEEGRLVLQVSVGAAGLQPVVTVGPRNFQITDFDSGAGAGPVFSLHRESASPAALDVIGQFAFSGRDNVGNAVTYASIYGQIVDATDGSEDAVIAFQAVAAGVSRQLAYIQSGNFTLYDYVDTATGGPNLVLNRQSASPAASDIMGRIFFNGKDSAGNDHTYGLISSVLSDPTNGSEDGNMYFTMSVAGALTDVMVIGASGVTVLQSLYVGQAVNVSSSVVVDQINMTWSNNDATAGPNLNLIRFSTSPAANDLLGQLVFFGYDSAGNVTPYAVIGSSIVDPTNGTEDGNINFYTMVGGTSTFIFGAGAGGFVAAVGLYSTNPIHGIGYTVGAGGTVTQLTSKATSVTINKVSGQITTHNASLAANTWVSFSVSCSAMAITDIVHVMSANGNYLAKASNPANGSFTIDLLNRTAGALADAVVITYVIIKASNT